MSDTTIEGESFADALDDLVRKYLDAGATKDAIVIDLDLKQKAMEDEIEDEE